MAKEHNRNSFISKVIKFHHISKSGIFVIPGIRHKRKSLHIKESGSGVFRVSEGKTLRGIVDLNLKYLTNKKTKTTSFKIPCFGITFLGVGSGFYTTQNNSSVIIWSEGKGILVDVINDNHSHAAKFGINDNDISHIFLTHVHSDHDAGIIQKIFQSKRTYLISSRIIYDSFFTKSSGHYLLIPKQNSR